MVFVLSTLSLDFYSGKFQTLWGSYYFGDSKPYYYLSYYISWKNLVPSWYYSYFLFSTIPIIIIVRCRHIHKCQKMHVLSTKRTKPNHIVHLKQLSPFLIYLTSDNVRPV